MATEKEKALIKEITDLAMDMGDGDYNVCCDYHGHIHGFDARISRKGASDWVYYADTVYLSGRKDIWKPEDAIYALNDILAAVKQYHPAFDADGVKL